mmetsp:Transcript_34439/g.42440  ORF Transcript_34439/g.42440 Transcript_34439/m.42440 type:complete len:97 (+) Transcript_34439:149-439(+)
MFRLWPREPMRNRTEQRLICRNYNPEKLIEKHLQLSKIPWETIPTIELPVRKNGKCMSADCFYYRNSKNGAKQLCNDYKESIFQYCESLINHHKIT